MNITALFRGVREFFALLLLSSYAGAFTGFGLYLLLKYEGVEFKFISCWMIMATLSINGLYICRRRDLGGSS